MNSVFNNKHSVQNNDSSMNYIVRVMKHRQQNDERQKELNTTLCKKVFIFINNKLKPKKLGKYGLIQRNQI